MSPEQPLVTVITPTYNREGLVGRAIDSVLAQTYENWELIVVNDGSTDETDKVVAEYIAQDTRIKYLEVENGGQSIARNKGFAISSGQFITYLDSDDEYYPEKIAAQVRVFQTSPVNNLGVVSCGKKNFRDGVYQSTWVPSLRGDILEPLLTKKVTIGATTSFLMVRREILESGVQWNVLPSVVDFDFILQICINYGFDYADAPLIKMNHHSGPRMFTNSGASRAYDILYKKYNELITRKPSIHRGFLDKYLFMKYRNGDAEDARRIFRDHYPKGTLSALLWKSVLMLPGANPGGVHFRAVNRLVKKL